MTRLALVALGGLAFSACVSTTPDDAPAASAPAASETAAAAAVSVATAAPVAASGGVVTVGTFADGAALTVDDAYARAGSLAGQTVRVAGTIRQVCQAKGCWLTFSTSQGQTLRVMTHAEGAAENEDVVFPMDAAGRHAEVVGTLAVVEESVERRRHLAEDAGASAEAVAAITEPSRAVSLTATGARISR